MYHLHPPLAVGASWCACSVYITEIAPSRYRGALVAISVCQGGEPAQGRDRDDVSGAGIEGQLAEGELVEHAAQSPQVRREAVDALGSAQGRDREPQRFWPCR